MPRTWTDNAAPALSAANLNALEAELATALWSVAALSAKTANYTATATDKVLIFNGSSLTATLPDPTTVSGRMYVIKNIHSTALTVVSAGTSKTIDGAASLRVENNLVLAVVSDGTTWHIVGGRELVPSSTYKPGVIDNTSGTATTFTVYTNIGSTFPTTNIQAGGERPILRLSNSAGASSNAHLIEAGQVIGGTFYKFFNVDGGGRITKLNNFDFTITAASSNPQDTISTSYGITMNTDTGLTFQKRQSGSMWPAWHYQPFGYSAQPQTKTANYTLEFKDTFLIGNGTSITFTLPDPAASGLTAGRKFEFKNINSTALSIVSAGTSKTIDGAASQSLPQWASMTVISDGTQWLIVSS